MNYIDREKEREPYVFSTEKESPREEKKIEKKNIIEKEGKVKVRLNIRKAPNLQAEVVRIEEPGKVLKYTQIKDEWAHLIDGNYCMAKFLDI